MNPSTLDLTAFDRMRKQSLPVTQFKGIYGGVPLVEVDCAGQRDVWRLLRVMDRQQPEANVFSNWGLAFQFRPVTRVAVLFLTYLAPRRCKFQVWFDLTDPQQYEAYRSAVETGQLMLMFFDSQRGQHYLANGEPKVLRIECQSDEHVRRSIRLLQVIDLVGERLNQMPPEVWAALREQHAGTAPDSPDALP